MQSGAIEIPALAEFKSAATLLPHPSQASKNWGASELRSYGETLEAVLPKDNFTFEQKLHEEVKELFEKYDTDHSNSLDPEEIYPLFNEMLARHKIGVQL